MALSSIAARSCSIAGLGIAFFGVAQLDLPIIRYVRSVTIHLPWDQLTVPWMAFTSNAGDQIGGGWYLVAVSAVFLAVGWLFRKLTVWQAGVESLVAHGMAALLANGLKHLLGRPRPKFTHSGDWLLIPSWVSGLDSFPSGHATASFAVATVITKRFPICGPLCLGIAAFVGLSRVLRGAHFPTDVVGGAVLGVLCGSVASAPWKRWRISLQEGLMHAAFGTCGLFASLWTLSHQIEEGIAGSLLVGLGLVALASGLWLRRAVWTGARHVGGRRWENTSLALIGYGLAAMTTSPLVLTSVGFACLAVWFDEQSISEEASSPSPGWTMMKESMLLGGMLFALLILYDGRGAFPFR